jgi:hypothetical protein
MVKLQNPGVLYSGSGAALLTLVSWLRYWSTGSVKVDENYPEAIPAVFLFLLSLSGIYLLWEGIRHPSHTLKQARISAGLAFLVSFFMLPAFSNDLFSLLAYGEAWYAGNDIYSDPAWSTATHWEDYVGSRWKETPSVYGPFSLLIAAIPACFNVRGTAGIFLLKALILLPVFLYFFTDWFENHSRDTLILLASPLFIINASGQLHNDILLLFFLFLSWRLAKAGKALNAGIIIGLAITVKLSALLFLPGILLLSIRNLRQFMLFSAALIPAVFVPYWFMGYGVSSFYEPFKLLQSMPPSGSFTDVLSEIIRVITSGMHIEVFSDPAESLAHDLAGKQHLWAILKPLSFYGWGILAGYLGIRMLLQRHDTTAIARYSLAIAVVFITLMSHKFHPWYLLWPMAILPFTNSDVWKRWFLIAGTIAATQDLAQLLPREILLFPVWVAVSSFATLLCFIWLFRSRYLS